MSALKTVRRDAFARGIEEWLASHDRVLLVACSSGLRTPGDEKWMASTGSTSAAARRHVTRRVEVPYADASAGRVICRHLPTSADSGAV